MPDAPRLTPFELVVDATVVTDAQIAPDGGRVVYATEPAARAGERALGALWLVDAAGGPARRLTSAEAYEHSPRWSPDGRRVAFLSDRHAAGVAQLCVIAVDGGEAARLTDRPSGVSAFEWSPDGARIAFASRDDATDAQKQELEARGGARVLDVDERRTGLWVLDVPDSPDGPPAARRVSPEGFHVGAYVDKGFAWAPDGGGFVIMGGASATTNARIRSEMFALALDGELRSLGRFEGLTSSPRYSPDGSTLAFIAAEDVIPARWVLQTMPAAGGAPTIVAPGYRGAFHSFAWLPEGDRLLTGVETGQQHAFLIADLEAGALAPAWDAPERPGDTGFSGLGGAQLTVSRDGRRCAFVRADDTSEGDVYVAELGGAARKLTDLNPWTRDEQWGETREVAWTSFDGLRIEGLLILPVGYRAGQRYPTLLHIHGGPAYAWTRHLYANWHDWGQFLAQRGYAVLMPNPRGSTGQGTDFLRAISGRYGEPDWQDLIAGVDWLIEQGIADPDQLVVGGWSGGGYLTNWTITHSDRFKAAIAGAGVSNWLSYLGTADIRAVFERYVGAPHEDPESAWRLSPVRSIPDAVTPTLYLHGEQDDRVPIGQAYEMYAGLKARGVETQMVVYPREGHGFVERNHQLDLLRRVVEWYDRHLGRA